MGGIFPPSRGIVGKNRSARSKTTVRSKRVFPLKVRRGPLYLFSTVLTILVYSHIVSFCHNCHSFSIIFLDVCFLLPYYFCFILYGSIWHIKLFGVSYCFFLFILDVYFAIWRNGNGVGVSDGLFSLISCWLEGNYKKVVPPLKKYSKP